MLKILIIRFSSIGDIVLTTPILRCMKEQLPNTKIHYLTKEVYCDILNKNPHIDRIHTIKSKLSEVIDSLCNEDFDYIIDLHNNLRTSLVKLRLRKKSYAFNKLNIRKWIYVNTKINLLPDIHIVDRYMNTVNSLGIKNDNKGLNFYIDSKDEIDINNLPLTHHNGYIGFAIGAKFKTKQLPIEKIISICKQINKPIVLLGGKEDFENGELIKDKAGNIIYNACGKYSIGQSASLVKQANKIITHDTGLMHIAAAFNKTIISIWGNTVPAFGMFPYILDTDNKSKIIQLSNLSCRPCSKIGYSECPKKHFNCMQMIDEKEIINALL